jgi:segregation and condensation protein B
MRHELEALLFASDQPLTLAKLASLFPDADRDAIRKEIESLRAEYDEVGRGFTIVDFGGGYAITTRPEHAALVRRLFHGRRKVRLSKAALECLAIIAYKQPATRLEIEEIRGVSVSGVIGTLMERDLIAIVGRAETLGHPLLYGTTRAFLDQLGLRTLKELPQLSELEDLLAASEELRQQASRDDATQDEDTDDVAGEAGEEGAASEADALRAASGGDRTD